VDFSCSKDRQANTSKATFLRQLWEKPAEKRPRGAPVKSGKAQIQDKAAIILGKATPLSNPVAAALNLGDCMIVEPTDRHRTNNRPFEKLSAALGHRKRTAHNVPSYHITWIAANGPPPPTSGREEYSHRCHQKWCVAPGHGVWETSTVNKKRNSCGAGRSHFLLDNGPDNRHLVKICPHDPECLSGVLVENMNHPSITKI
jgi:hypothetical protein